MVADAAVLQGMNFFEQQAAAKRRTTWLVLLFLLGVAAMVASIYAVLAMAVVQVPAQGAGWSDYLDPELLAGVALGVCGVVAAGSLFKLMQLGQGGQVVATMLGGRPVAAETTDPGERRLLNVVEEMAIAAGTAVPQVFVLDREEGINAFAAGNGPGDAAIGITAGALQRFNRDELQGVIAHEFSHIVNGDMRLNMRIIGVVFGILCLAMIGRVLLDVGLRTAAVSRSDRDSKGGLQLAFFGLGFALFLIGYAGVFFGRLIQAAVSRQREYLADASAVQFTRNPDGLASALATIQREGSVMHSPRAAEVGHLFFSEGLKFSFFGLFATHPPLPDRIRRLGADPENLPSRPAPPKEPLTVSPEENERLARGTGTEAAARLAALLPGMGTLLGEAVGGALRRSDSAQLVIFALLLDQDPALREAQLQALALDPAASKSLLTLEPAVSELAPRQRLAMVDLAVGPLRHLGPGPYATFRQRVTQLVEADAQIDLFEFVLQKILLRHLDQFYREEPQAKPRYNSVVPLLPDCGVLFSAVAWMGYGDGPSKDRAFAAGVQALGPRGGAFPLQRVEACDLAEIDAALDRVAAGDQAVRRLVVSATTEVVRALGEENDLQVQLLRAVADALDCPAPVVTAP